MFKTLTAAGTLMLAVTTANAAAHDVSAEPYACTPSIEGWYRAHGRKVMSDIQCNGVFAEYKVKWDSRTIANATRDSGQVTVTA